MVSRSESDLGHPVDRHVGRRIAEKRIALGYNQSDLGRALGLTFQQVQKYEKGTNRVSASKLWATAEFLGVDISYFFDGLVRDGGHPAVVSDAPAPTRLSLDVQRALGRLTTGQQRLTLELVREMGSATAKTGGDQVG